MTTIACIFARGGSKGVKDKNLRLIAGRPLVAHAVEAARAASLVDDVWVSSDSPEILAVAEQYGARALLRPAELAADDAPEWLAWRHAIGATYLIAPEDVFVSVPCTSPLRLPEDIDACIRALDADADAVITVTPARRNPYYNQVVLDECGHARTVIGYGTLSTRQAAPLLYDVTTVAYAAWPHYVLSAPSLLSGRVRAVVVPPERAIDIDTELDLRIAEALYANYP